MLSFIKFLKIVLPVATVTSATIATTFLVSSSRDDLLNKEKEEDSKLTDFVNLSEDFQEKKLFYAKQGDGDGTVALGKEESERLQKLIDEGADINNLGNRSNNVPDAAGGPSQAINMPPQGAEPPKGVSTSEDSSDSGPSAESKPHLSDEKNSEVSEGLDSREKPNGPDKGVGEEGNGGANEQKVSVSATSSEEDLSRERQLSIEPDVSKKEGGPTSPTQDEPNIEVQPQGDVNDSSQNSENLKEKQSELQSSTLTTSQDGEGSGSEPRQDSVAPESDMRTSGGLSGEPEGQQQRGQDDLSGSSDESRFDLETLQRWQNELGSAQSALNVILSEL